jgi:DMSO/TMAO reductase YedYZ molybdopterin-dependent catalytic subunit
VTRSTWRALRLMPRFGSSRCSLRSYRAADVSATHANDRDTLLALRLNGEELHLDHGYPVRLIGPNRPGVLQTKWVARLVVT